MCWSVDLPLTIGYLVDMKIPQELKKLPWLSTAFAVWGVAFSLGGAGIAKGIIFWRAQSMLFGAVAYGFIARLLFWVAMKLIKNPDRRLRWQANYDKAAIVYVVLMFLTIVYGAIQN